MHGLSTADECRQQVLVRVSKQWPDTISAQTMRSATDRFRDKVTDEEFAMDECACCAREYNSKDPHDCDFPVRAATLAPVFESSVGLSGIS